MLSHANKTKQAEGLLKERKQYSTLLRWDESGQARIKCNCMEEQRNIGLYLNERAKYSGVSLQVFPGKVFANHSFPLGGGILLQGLSWQHGGDGDVEIFSPSCNGNSVMIHYDQLQLHLFLGIFYRLLFSLFPALPPILPTPSPHSPACLSYIKNFLKILGLIFAGKEPAGFFYFLHCQNLQIRHPSPHRKQEAVCLINTSSCSFPQSGMIYLEHL